MVMFLKFCELAKTLNPFCQWPSAIFGRFPKHILARGPPKAKKGPNRIFALKTPQYFGKRVIWVHSAQPALCSFWVSTQKWYLNFWPLRPEKRPKGPALGNQQRKTNQRLRRHQNFSFNTRLNFSDWFINGPAATRLSTKFVSPANKFVLTGLEGRICHFNVTAWTEGFQTNWPLAEDVDNAIVVAVAVDAAIVEVEAWGQFVIATAL